MGFADYLVELNVPGYGLLAVAVMSPAKITGQKNKISLVAIKTPNSDEVRQQVKLNSSSKLNSTLRRLIDKFNLN